MKKIKKLNCFILIFILTISILFSASFFLCYVSADDIIYQGIDVSEYQGDIDFEQVKNAGIEVVYIRAGEGDSYVDKYFEINSEKIKSTDLNFGYYYYVTATTPQQGAQQAKTFAALIKNKSYNARPVMDFEYFNGMSKNEINEIAVAFMDTLENETSITPMLYTDAY
ncbi:MAG: GH25 family lysozyme, partial [Oscillospiraceae bacterium]